MWPKNKSVEKPVDLTVHSIRLAADDDNHAGPRMDLGIDLIYIGCAYFSNEAANKTFRI